MFLLSVVIYAGLAGILVGTIGVVRPMRRLWLPTRRRAATIAIAGVALIAVAFAWPTPLKTSAQRGTILDQRMPSFQFVEHHETRVRASPAQVFESIRQVRAPEIRFFNVLTWIRHPRFRRELETILTAPEHKPLLDVALATSFRKLGEAPDRELVIGTRVARDVVAAMNFAITPEGDGWSRVTTETRVFASTPQGLRAFTVYWRLIYPGSALIRIEWLRAIKIRAERAGGLASGI